MMSVLRMFGRFEVRYVYLKAMPEYDIRDGVLRSIKPCAEAPGEIAWSDVPLG
ncbi:hypothetical protein BU26DRAFT_515897 [Trematosphaeria pertusa]|uniref:Uncharacterized protein n=1 Tax=Trematosphaeria pertusa TaxID=390896 RepID=A0A6A6IUJ1_9PLEO|nr:uncharacterized protein BU26DRAFT_515897 [Trematosphaeria pertusa]KAF2253562.1 hypothetical protein BU26DRAFT_515897 [Trematosphaeria pertusa]